MGGRRRGRDLARRACSARVAAPVRRLRHRRLDGPDGAGATLAAFAIATAISVPTAGISTLGVVLAVVVVAFLVGAWSRRRLGGVTGDVFRAAVELGETAGSRSSPGADPSVGPERDGHARGGQACTEEGDAPIFIDRDRVDRRVADRGMRRTRAGLSEPALWFSSS